MPLTLVHGEEQAHELGADAFRLKPIEPAWLVSKLQELGKSGSLEKILVVDDDPSHRRLLRELLARETPCVIMESADGRDGLHQARQELPSVVFLDLVLPDMTGFEVIERLKSNPDTAHIPVIIFTSKHLDDLERDRLASRAVAILTKSPGTPDGILAKVREGLIGAGLLPVARKRET